MKKVRVIARLDVKGPNVVKGVQYEALRVMGKPGALAEEYFLQGADELLYLDTVASLYRRDNLLHIVREASKSIHIPFTAGGGVRSLDDMRDLLQAGADKVAMNTAATKRPELIREAANLFGSQCVVLSIEAKKNGKGWEVYTDNGRQETGLDVVEWARRAENLGAGEILLTSVDRDGTKRGLDRELIETVSAAVSVPLIASGGAASPEEIADVIHSTKADAVAVASLLHYGIVNVADIKEALSKRNLLVRPITAEERKERISPAADADEFNYNRFTLRHLETSSSDKNAAVSVAVVPNAIDPREADVCVVNYEINNVRSVVSACERLGKKVAVVETPEGIKAARRLILPGVGAFESGMKALKEKGLIQPLIEKVQSGMPLLGICLGMQMLFDESEEFGAHPGLGIIPGRVVSFPRPEHVTIPGYKLPHIGWSALYPPKKNQNAWEGTLLARTKPGEFVYFVHSFYPVPADPALAAATAEYGGIDFCAAVKHKNISATQFHPEKSGAAGLAILTAFCEETSST